MNVEPISWHMYSVRFWPNAKAGVTTPPTWCFGSSNNTPQHTSVFDVSMYAGSRHQVKVLFTLVLPSLNVALP